MYFFFVSIFKTKSSIFFGAKKMACLLAKMAGRVEFEKFYSCFRQMHLANVAQMTQYLKENASHPKFDTKLTFLRRCFYQNIADLNIATAKKIFELMMVEEHAKNAMVQEACKKGHNVDYVVFQTDISKIDFPKGTVGESHDAGFMAFQIKKKGNS